MVDAGQVTIAFSEIEPVADQKSLIYDAADIIHREMLLSSFALVDKGADPHGTWLKAVEEKSRNLFAEAEQED